ncbi:MAG: osmotically-inducible protein OsmY, partial [Parvicella sp.]
MSNQPSQLRNLIRNSILASSIALLSACIPAAIGVISVTAIDLIKERRTMGTIIDDNLAEASIKGSILKDKSMRPGVHISVTALNGVVLLSGEVTSETQKAHAEDIANSYQG